MNRLTLIILLILLSTSTFAKEGIIKPRKVVNQTMDEVKAANLIIEDKEAYNKEVQNNKRKKNNDKKRNSNR